MTTIRGLAELNAMLQSLPVKLERNILRGALRAGAGIVKDEGKVQLASNGSFDTGLLSKGLKVSAKAKGGVVTARVKATGPHGYIAHWIEHGAAAHVIAGKDNGFLAFGGGVHRSVLHPGIQAKPFLRPALDGKRAEVLMAAGEYIKKRLTKEGLDASGVDLQTGE
jgi:hypothetical protein